MASNRKSFNNVFLTMNKQLEGEGQLKLSEEIILYLTDTRKGYYWARLINDGITVCNTPFHTAHNYHSVKFTNIEDIDSFIDWVYDNLIENKEDKLKAEQDYIETAGVFWLVWCPQGGNPKYRHNTRESAETESARLAKQEPEKEFYVLKTVSKTFAETKINKVNYE